MDLTAALQDYFNCHHCPTSSPLRSEVAERLFNVLTPTTVNTLIRIHTIIGKRQLSPLQAVTQTENVALATRLIVDLGADLLFSEGDGIPPLRSLLRTYSNTCYYERMGRPDWMKPVQHEAVCSALTAGVERVTDIPQLLEDLGRATRQSGLSQEDGADVAQMLRPSIQTAMRNIAWGRRRHLIAAYDAEEEKWNQL